MSQKTVQKETEADPADMGEFTVTDELYEISEATNRDGTVDVKLYDFEKVDSDTVKVRFYTPTMEERWEKMPWPRKDSADYKFVRLCREAVGGLNAAEFIKTDGATIKADPDDWKIQAELSLKNKLKENISNASLSLALKYLGLTLLAVWIASIFTVLIGGVIVGAATILGIVAPIVGLWKLWVGAIIALMATGMMAPPAE